MYLTPDSLFGKRDTHDDASHIERVTDEPYCHARTLTGWRRDIVQISPGRFQGSVFETCGRDVRVAREFLSRGVFHIGSAYAGGLTLGLIRSTNKRAAIWNGIQLQPDTVVCVPPGTEMVFRSHDDTRVIWLFVPTGLLDAQALAVFDDAEASITQPMCFDDGALAVRIISAYQAVRKLTGLRIPGEPGSLHPYDALMAEIVDLARGFLAIYGRRQPQLGIREAHAMKILRRVRLYLRQRIGESICLHDLCEAAAASERTVRKACEIVTGESPMSFLRAMRLNQVRRALLNAATPVRITETGARWGFLHMPQFSRDYRELFGELPSETIRRQLRDSGNTTSDHAGG